MDRFEHVRGLAHFGFRHMTEDAGMKMLRSALPARIRQMLRRAFGQTPASIRDDQFHAGQAAIDQVAQESVPA